MSVYDGSPIKLVAMADKSGNPEQRGYLNGTTSQSVKNGPGTLYGFTVNSHTNGTLKFWDNTAGSGTIMINTITLAAGPGFYMIPDGVDFNTGLFVTVGGTIDYTIIYS